MKIFYLGPRSKNFLKRHFNEEDLISVEEYSNTPDVDKEEVLLYPNFEFGHLGYDMGIMENVKTLIGLVIDGKVKLLGSSSAETLDFNSDIDCILNRVNDGSKEGTSIITTLKDLKNTFNNADINSTDFYNIFNYKEPPTIQLFQKVADGRIFNNEEASKLFPYISYYGAFPQAHRLEHKIIRNDDGDYVNQEINLLGSTFAEVEYHDEIFQSWHMSLLESNFEVVKKVRQIPLYRYLHHLLSNIVVYDISKHNTGTKPNPEKISNTTKVGTAISTDFRVKD